MNPGDHSFFTQLLGSVLDAAKYPKVQLERALGPIMYKFMEPLMTALLHEDVRMVAPEFPIRCSKNNKQSSNIDWLMYAPGTQRLVFVELKTNINAYRSEQAKSYAEVQCEVEAKSAQHLQDFVCLLQSDSKSEKYDLLHSQLSEIDDWSAVKELLVVYLAPGDRPVRFQPACTSVSNNPNPKCLPWQWHSFADLPAALPQGRSPWVDMWPALHAALLKVDEQERDLRADRAREEDAATGSNYKGIVGWDEVKQLAREKPQELVIGFVGGAKALRKTPIEELRERRFKYDDDFGQPRAGKPVKQRSNWILGAQFLEAAQHVEGLGGLHIDLGLDEAQLAHIRDYAGKHLPPLAANDPDTRRQALHVTFAFDQQGGRSLQCQVQSEAKVLALSGAEGGA